MAKVTADVYTETISNLNVVNSFCKLGYLKPQDAVLRCAPDYVFVPPPISEGEVAKDIVSLEKRIADAKASGLRFAKAKPASPQAPASTQWSKPKAAPDSH